MARPKEKEVVMTKQGKRTYRIDKKTWKKKTWRPSKFTEEVVKKLEELLSNDVELGRACRFVWVSEQAYYDECRRNPEFLEKMQKAQEYVGVLADRTVAKAIRDWDTQTARWYKEKKDERFKTKPTQISMSQWADPETGEISQWLMVEFTIKE